MLIETLPRPTLAGEALAWGEPWTAGIARYRVEAADKDDLDNFDEEDFDDDFDDDFEEELEDEYELSEFEDVTDDDLLEDDDEDIGTLGGDFVDEDAEPEEAPPGEDDAPSAPEEKGKSKGKGKAKPAKDDDDFEDDE